MREAGFFTCFHNIEGISWENASVAFHTYGIDGKEDATLTSFYTALKGKGIAHGCCTEPNLTLKVITTKLFERDGVSETHFISAHDIASNNSAFYSWVNSNNITWVPDFGTWPKPAAYIINSSSGIGSGIAGVNYSYHNRRFNCLGKPISETSDISPGCYFYKSKGNAWSMVNFDKFHN